MSNQFKISQKSSKLKPLQPSLRLLPRRARNYSPARFLNMADWQGSPVEQSKSIPLSKDNASRKKITRATSINTKFISSVNLQSPKQYFLRNRRELDLDLKDNIQRFTNKSPEHLRKNEIHNYFITNPRHKRDHFRVVAKFFEQVKANNLPEVKKKLQRYPDLLKEKDCFGQTGLHLAVRANLVKMAELLISQGANGKIRDCDGRTPESIARNYEFDKIFGIFYEKYSKNEHIEAIVDQESYSGDIEKLIQVIVKVKKSLVCE